MDFFEFVVAISITVLLPITIVKTVLDFKRAKLEAERGLETGEGLTVGELKRMLAEVVREANTPLVERIEALEESAPALTSSPDAYDEREMPYDEEDLESEAEKTLGRRLRS